MAAKRNERTRLRPHGAWGASGREKGFTLVELVVSIGLLVIVILILFQIIASMATIWSNSTGTISSFQAARGAFSLINQELGRATLKNYLDYINDPSANNPPFGQFRTSLSTTSQQTFVPVSFARASELHFICGPAATVLQNGAAATNPGDTVFFQTPLGVVNSSGNKDLLHSLNDVGFYIQYSDLANSAFPGWLHSYFGGSTHYGYRLVECLEPTESLSIYQSTSAGSYSRGWLPSASSQTFPVAGTTYNESVLADNVILLIFRPRLEPRDEEAVAAQLGQTYNSTTQNSIISPNYAYDSRTWQTGYAFGSPNVQSSAYGLLMRNQLPPIVDVAMVCLDPASAARLHLANLPTPPASLTPAAGLFVSSAKMDADLTSFGNQLTANHFRYRIFRSSVQMQEAAWVNE